MMSFIKTTNQIALKVGHPLYLHKNSPLKDLLVPTESEMPPSEPFENFCKSGSEDIPKLVKMIKGKNLRRLNARNLNPGPNLQMKPRLLNGWISLGPKPLWPLDVWARPLGPISHCGRSHFGQNLSLDNLTLAQNILAHEH